MLTEYNFHCPFCQQQLTRNNEVHFLIDYLHEKKLIRLNPAPGIYEYTSNDDLFFNIGEKVNFYCTSCQTDLTSKKYAEYIEIHLKVSKNLFFEVLFSPIYGNKSTYVIMENGLVKYSDDLF